MSIVRVWPQVSAEDVLAGASAEELAAIESRLLPFMEHVPDLNESRPVQIVRALTRPRLEEGAAQTWFKPYHELGLDRRWLDMVQRLRLRSLASFCEVWDTAGEVLDTWWIARDGEAIRTDDTEHRVEAAPSLPLYTLQLFVTVPRDAASSAPDRPQAPPLPVRPLGARKGDLAAVDALASLLAPRVEATFNGAARVQSQPLLAPICALAATVWTAMQHPKMQTKHKEPRYKKAAFYACLDGLALGEHRITAERILRRDHPRHIHIDACSAPDQYTDPRWRSGLGMFAEDKDGHLIQVTEHNRRQLAPTILLSLSGGEPW
jgi:hypothetical protein